MPTKLYDSNFQATKIIVWTFKIHTFLTLLTWIYIIIRE